MYHIMKSRNMSQNTTQFVLFESRSPRIAQARVRLATNTLPQTLHRAGALYTGYAL